MTQQPDELFRKKLREHLRSSHADAWNKIEGRLERRKNKPYRWIAAAAVLLIGVIATLITNKFEQPNLQSKNAVSKHSSNENIIPKHKEPIKPIEAPHHATISESQKISSVVKKKKRPVQSTSIVPIQEEPLKKESDITIEEIPEKNIALEKISTEEVNNKQTATPTSKNFKLVLNADEVNKKYLANSDQEDATTLEKEASKLRKLLDKVYELKTNQDPFGEIREKKDEILALQFKNEKHRNK